MLCFPLPPAVVASALDLVQVHPLAVDDDVAGAGGQMIAVGMHGGNGALALVDLNEDRLDADRALIGGDDEFLRLAALGKGDLPGFSGRRDGQLAAGVGLAVIGGAQTVLPGQEAVGHGHVARQIEERRETLTSIILSLAMAINTSLSLDRRREILLMPLQCNFMI